MPPLLLDAPQDTETPEQRAKRLGLTAGGGGDETPEQRAKRLGLSTAPPAPAKQYVSPFAAAHPDFAARLAAATAADQRADAARDPYGLLEKHLLNFAAGVPSVEAVEAEAGSLGSRLTSTPMSYTQSLNTLRDATQDVGPRLQFHVPLLGKQEINLERLAGGLMAAPLLPEGDGLAGALKVGGAYGAESALGSADKESLLQRGINTAIDAAGGSIAGGILHGAGTLGTKIGGKLAARYAPRLASILTRLTGAAPEAADAQARKVLANALETGGVRPGVAAATVPTTRPTAITELGSQNVARVVRAARNVPGSTAAQESDRFLSARAAGAGRRIQDAISTATGHAPTDTELPIEQHIQNARSQSGPLYKQADAYGQIKDPETIAEVKRLLKEPVFQEGWRRGETMARIEGSDAGGPMLPKDVEAAAEKAKAAATPAAASPKNLFATESEAPPAPPKRTQSLRDNQGRVRQDLSKVSDEDLDAEWQRLAELHGQEESENAAVEESGYRGDYYELPETERLGKKGGPRKGRQEDLPDADSNVDPDVLAEHNKTVSNYKRRTLVRQQQQKLMDRLQAELANRPSAGDFEFGANKFVPNRPEPEPAPGASAAPTPGPTVRQINRWKKGMDATIEMKMRGAALSRDEARVLRQQLNNVLGRVDAEVPAFKQARDAYRGPMELRDAAEAGAEHFAPSRPPGALARDLAAMSTGEQNAYRQNALNKIVENIRKVATNQHVPEAGRATNILQRVMGSEDAADRLGMLFPDDASFQGFLTQVEDEALYPKTNQFLRNQSSTNAQQLESDTSVPDWADVAGTAMDAAHRPGSTLLRALRQRRGMSPEVANQIGRISTATGENLKGILREMEMEKARLTKGRRLMSRATKAATIGGTQEEDDWRKTIEGERRHIR